MKSGRMHDVAGHFWLFGANEISPHAEKLMALWLEFERGETAEARFALTADRAMPMLLNLAANGQSWVENGIHYERVIRKIKPLIQAGCPALWKYLEMELLTAREVGYFAG